MQVPSPGKLALSEQVMRRVPAITGIVADRRRKRAWDGGERCADDQKFTTCTVGRSLIELGQTLG